MKNVLVKLLVLVSILGISSTANAQDVNIPDADFKSALIAHVPSIDTNNDGEIQVSEAAAFDGALTLFGKSISDATGLEAFTNLTKLSIGSNDLTSLDLSGNTLITTLFANHNQLTSIDLSSNPLIDTLNVQNNSLTSLDISNQANLNYAIFSTNNVSSFSHHPNFNTLAWAFGYGDNPIASTIDFTSYPNLGYLLNDNSGLTSIDVSGMSSLIYLSCSNNSLTFLDISNGNEFFFLNAQNNNLSCIQVSDPDVEIANLFIDQGVSFDVDCANPTVKFIDAALKTALLGISGVDGDSDGEISVSEAGTFSGSLGLSSQGITDISGLEFFTSAIGIDLSGNVLVNLNLNANTALTSVNVSNNDLKYFSIVNGNNTSIVSFDATGNSNLSCISVDNPTYSTSNWTNIPIGTGFDTDCIVDIPNTNFKNALLTHSPVIDTNDDNEIQVSEAQSFSDEINFYAKNVSDATGLEAFTNITSIRAGFNGALTSIDISQNRAITKLEIENSGLSFLDVTKNTKLTVITAYGNDITAIDLSQNTRLRDLWISGNQLTSLDLSQNDALRTVRIWDNNISSFTPSLSAGYSELSYGENPFAASFDFTPYASTLFTLNVSNSGMTSLDVSSMTQLRSLFADNNNLTTLNANNGTILFNLRAQNNDDLSCISVFNIDVPATNQVSVDPGVSFEEDCNNPALRIPDPNFNALLLSQNPSLDLDSDGRISTSEAAAFTGTLDASNSGILSLVGIEAFTSLTGLNLDDNQVLTLDLSQNVALTSVSAANNALTVFRIDNGNNSAITSFDVTGNPDLDCIMVSDVTFAQNNWTNIPVGLGFGTDCAVNIPNATLKTTLLTHSPIIDTNSDGEIQISEAFAFTDDLFITANPAITDLVGVEAFANITYLYAGSSDLQSINVTQNTKIRDLRVLHNRDLSEINLTTMPDLSEAWLSSQSLTSIDLSNNPNLVNLYIGVNDLTELDLSNNPRLEILSASKNQIASIDISENTELEQIFLSQNQLSSLDISHITGYTTGNITINPALQCVKVHNVGFATARLVKSNNTSFSEDDCPPAIPDLKLLQALQAHNPVIDTNDDDIIQLTEMLAYTDTLFLGFKLITDLSGLENFENIVGLELNNNSLNSIDPTPFTKLKYLNVQSQFAGGISTLDLSANIELEHLKTGFNGLNALDVTNNAKLKELYCQNLSLSSLDLTNNPLLTTLEAQDNDFLTLDLTANSMLEKLNLNNNPITTLDVTQNPALQRLDLQLAQLSSIDLSNNSALTRLSIQNASVESLSTLDLTNLTSLEFVDLAEIGLSSITFGSSPNLTDLNLNQNPLTNVDLSLLTGLEDLSIYGTNTLTSLALTNHPNLVQIDAYENALTSIDLSGCPSLEEVYVEHNQLQTIDFSNNPLLYETYVHDNPLTEIDFSQNPALYSIDIYDTSLEFLDFSQNPNIQYVYAHDNNLFGFNIANGNNEDINGLDLTNNPNLNCVTVDDVAYAQANFTDIDTGLSFSTSCPNYENEILAFTFTGIDGDAVIDAAETAVDAVALAGTNMNDLAPTITVSEGATISPNSGVAQDFTNSLVYTVTAEDGTTKEWDITVTEALADPTDIALTQLSIDENNSLNDVIGTFSTTDASFNDSFTYTFVDGDGDDDTSSFKIVGDELQADEVFDFETKSTYNIRVQTDDGNGGLFEKALVININDVNEAPSDLDLVGREIDESTPIGTLIGILSTIDPDAGDTHTYSYTNGCSACDPIGDESAPFIIVGNELRSNIVFDFETASSYGIDVTSTDAGGLTRTEGKIITINDLPASITSLDLSNQSINENESANTLVGSFTTTGEDLSGSYTYTLVSGDGDDDNSSFTISDDQLSASESFDFETKNSYDIRVMTDDGTLTTEEAFTISVANVFEAPSDIDLSANSIVENNEVNVVIGSLTTTDEDAGETHTYALAAGDGDTDNSSFNINGDELRATDIFDFETKSSYSVRIETNDGNGGTYQEAFTINITNENESISVANPIADESREEGFGSFDIDLSNVFSDEDGDALAYTVTSSDATVVTVASSGATLTVTEVGIGTATINVMADDGSGITTSDEFEVEITATPLGLDDGISLEVYPNPTRDFVNIQSEREVNIQLINLRGQTIQSAKGQSLRLDLQNLSAGTYLLKISDGESTTTRRIIKAN